MDPMLQMIKDMKEDMREMDRKIDLLLEFRWQVVGGSLVISGIVTLVFELIHLTLK